MGQRYRIPFKDTKNRSYEVAIYREGYTGSVEKLTGASDVFAVEGTDEEFVYTAMRTSNATVTILDKNLLLDLFSINNQYAPVKLWKNGRLMWTGYIKPEQFTQPYKPRPGNISIDCISATGTLENIKYERQNADGFITAWELLRYVIASAHGGYEYVYIPWIYGASASSYSGGGNVFTSIRMSEQNFIEDERTLDEVLTYWLRFFNWTMYDYGGSLYIVDADWTGSYRRYDEGLSSYTTVTPNTVRLQDVGFAGDDHKIDVLPGYNKCTVRAVNNVFDTLVEEEDVDTLVENGHDYTFREGKSDNLSFVQKRFVIPKNWVVYGYDANGSRVMYKNADNTTTGGALVKIAEYTGKEQNGTVKLDISDYDWTLCVQSRPNTNIAGKELVVMSGAKGCAWKNGALAINGSLIVPWNDSDVAFIKQSGKNGAADVEFKLRIGNYYWNGSGWTTTSSTFSIHYANSGAGSPLTAENTKTPDMPYKGLNGYIVTLPDDRPITGDLEFTVMRTGDLSYTPDQGAGSIKFYGYIYKGLSFTYGKKDTAADEGEDGDRLYENVINEAFMSELDEIEFGISSYNADGATYSKALMGDDFLTDNIYSAVMGGYKRPEEGMITRVINRYRDYHIRLTQVIKNNDAIVPFTIVTDASQPGKRFLMQNGTWDYRGNKLTLAMVENNG